MRPSNAPIHRATADVANADLRVVAVASFRPRGASYNPRAHLRRRIVALRGDAAEGGPLAIAFSWSDGVVRVQIVTKRGAVHPPASGDVERAIDVARAMAAVDDDPAEFLAMVRDHAVLGRLARTADPRIAKAPTVFECLTISIIEQLVTGEEARAAVRRLWRQAGDPIVGTHLVAAPTPHAIRRVPMWRMHEIGIGSRRALTLHEAAGRGDAIERLRDDGHAPEIFVEKIQSLHGVGPWTANAVARSALGFADAIPVGDFHAPFVLSSALAGRDDLTLDDRDEADRVMIEALEPFRPHRARVAILFETRDAVANKNGKPWRLPRVDAHRREPWKY